MQIRNTPSRYGVVAAAIHWIVALTVIGLFVLGFWMVDLTYYDAWYVKAPDIHRSIGVLLFLLMVFRIIWRSANPNPTPVAGHKRWEIVSARVAHLSLYVLLLVAIVSGYLISTADGSNVNVFGWFKVPSVTGQIKGLEDTAGIVHYWSTWAVIALAIVHAAGAMKHHMLDRDNTLRRILGL